MVTRAEARGMAETGAPGEIKTTKRTECLFSALDNYTGGLGKAKARMLVGIRADGRWSWVGVTSAKAAKARPLCASFSKRFEVVVVEGKDGVRVVVPAASGLEGGRFGELVGVAGV